MSSSNSLSGDAADALVARAREAARPLHVAAALDDFSDLVSLASSIGSARIVAFGEPVHGAQEPLAFRNRLFRFLVAQLGFTAIALETAAAGSQRIDDFIQGLYDESPDVVARELSWGFGTYAPNVELIAWLRAYNLAADTRRKVRFHGFDVSSAQLAILDRQMREACLVAAARDATMAQNVLAILGQEGAEGRIALFAHNAHVMNSELRGGRWSDYPQAPLQLGHHLKVALADEIFIIGASAVVRASAADIPGGGCSASPTCTLDAALERAGLPHFFLDLRSLRRVPELACWLDAVRPMRTNYDTEVLLRPGKAFDALVFFGSLTPCQRTAA
jgi:erythromycin esterase-like protein